MKICSNCNAEVGFDVYVLSRIESRVSPEVALNLPQALYRCPSCTITYTSDELDDLEEFAYEDVGRKSS